MEDWFNLANWQYMYSGHRGYPGHWVPYSCYLAPWGLQVFLETDRAVQPQVDFKAREQVAKVAQPEIEHYLREVRTLRAQAIRFPKGSVARRALRQMASSQVARCSPLARGQLQRDSGHYKD